MADIRPLKGISHRKNTCRQLDYRPRTLNFLTCYVAPERRTLNQLSYQARRICLLGRVAKQHFLIPQIIRPSLWVESILPDLRFPSICPLGPSLVTTPEPWQSDPSIPTHIYTTRPGDPSDLTYCSVRQVRTSEEEPQVFDCISASSWCMIRYHSCIMYDTKSFLWSVWYWYLANDYFYSKVFCSVYFQF